MTAPPVIHRTAPFPRPLRRRPPEDSRIYCAAVTNGPRRAGAIAALAFLLACGTAQPSVPVEFPLRVSLDHRRLEDHKGRPFLVVGDTAWSLIAQLDDEDVARYLDDRAGRGFNAIIVSLIEHKFATHAPATRAGVQPFLAPGDFTRPNPDYFDRAHRVIEQAGARGIAVWLCAAYLGWDGGDEGFFKEINAAGGQTALHRYGRFVGDRFKDLPNIVWMLGGDYAFPPSLRWLGDQLAAGLREGGAGQVITAHGGQTSAVETFGDRSWLGMDTVYTYADDQRPLHLLALQREPARPFVLIESTYEGEHEARPERVRRQAWTAMLSGAAGQFFGNNPMWHFDGPTLFPFTGDWRTALDSVGSRDMARLGNFFRGLPWPDLRPDREGSRVSVEGGPPAAAAVGATTADGRLLVAYIPALGEGGRVVSVNFPAINGRPPAVKWINPARDEPARQIIDRFWPSSGPAKMPTPGDNGTGANDWVLVLGSDAEQPSQP